LDGNHAILSDVRLPAWFRNLRRLAREQALSEAVKYLRYAPELASCIPTVELDSLRLLVGGHQPELFHPGVWFKNFLMSEISQRTNALALQVIVDHDVARLDTLRVPSCSTTQTQSEKSGILELVQRSVPLPIREDAQPRVPWHATNIGPRDQEKWNKTIASVQQSMTSCKLGVPILSSRREILANCIASNENIGDAFSQFRHSIEIANGVRNLEVPLGRLCSESAFGFFVQQCVQNPESLWSSYNTCRDAYRLRRKIRNQAQPVLELLRQVNWFELPFWIYSTTGKSIVERKRLWVCKQQNQVLMCDHPDEGLRTVSVWLPLDRQDLVNVWQEMNRNGICVRPRALMTTLYLRCFIGDLFVHGIGGGLYDELTDDIMSHWLNLEPPTYLISSASLHLPFRFNSDFESISPLETGATIQRQLHLMRSVPERFLDKSIQAERDLHDAHQRLLANIPERGHKRDWHVEIAKCKKKVEMVIEPQKRVALAKLESIQRSMHQNKIQKSREYSFVLFEEKDVVGRLAKLAAATFSQNMESGK